MYCWGPGAPGVIGSYCCTLACVADNSFHFVRKSAAKLLGVARRIRQLHSYVNDRIAHKSLLCMLHLTHDKWGPEMLQQYDSDSTRL